MSRSDVHELESCCQDNDDHSSNHDGSIGDISQSSTSTNSILKSCRKSYHVSKRRVLFDSVDVFYFDREQGNTCVPCQGGYTLGMASNHSSFERFSLQVFQKKRKREKHRQIYKKCVDGKLDLPQDQVDFLKSVIQTPPCSPLSLREEETSSSSESCGSFASSDSYVCPGDSSSDEECDYSKKLEDLYILNAISLKKRKLLLKKAGVPSIDDEEKDECERIRQSRTVCGCDCPNGLCYPSTCQCALNGISCQVDRASFPCACMLPNGCANPLGRIKFDQNKARTHYLHTRMRLEMEETSSSALPILTRKRAPSPELDPQTRKPRLDGDALAKDEDERFLANYNTTLHGGCRDCQNDNYVKVLMHEWRFSRNYYQEESREFKGEEEIWPPEAVDSGYFSSPDEPQYLATGSFVDSYEADCATGWGETEKQPQCRLDPISCFLPKTPPSLIPASTSEYFETPANCAPMMQGTSGLRS
ncbi:cysteine-serine-rich nuclear protein [Cichlidogyrus casuarinus]|uniref:Cysteine-serine-rich nuclear protein n=1 Tax=Cichlidogyrus casuarinus TaxID=1844966 RepID=A0ABD2PUD6_9PLAT